MKSADITKPDTSTGGSTPTIISVKKLAQILDISERGVRWKSENENWPFDAVPVAGGIQKLFPLQTLPIEIQRRVRIHYGELPPELAELVGAGVPAGTAFNPGKIANGSRSWDQAQPWQRELAQMRREVLDCLEQFRATFKGGGRAAVDAFCQRFAAREVPGLEPAIYSRIHKVRKTQLYEWRQRFTESGIAGLISGHGACRGTTTIPAEQQQFILSTVAANPDLPAWRVAQSLRAKYGKKPPKPPFDKGGTKGGFASRRQVQLFLEQKREQDPALFTFLDNPDAYKAKFQLALGNASEKAERFLHYLEVDSTPADVMCNDNKRYTIIGGIDVFSRKCKFLVSPTSNSWAISALIRNIVIDWGLPENIVRDNGQDYASRMVNQALQALEINVIAVAPFTPEGKPHIERAFGTLTRGLFEGLPGYIGHNVADRTAIENRKSFAERMGRGKKENRGGRFCKNALPEPLPKNSNYGPLPAGEGGVRGTVSIGLTRQELQQAIDGWTEQVYHQRSHGSLGASPNAKAASVPVRPRRIEDHRALDILLAPCGERIIRKKGLQYENGLYWHDELIDYMGRTVLIREDVRDAGRLCCFDTETHTFICEAQDMAISGLTVGEKIAARKRANKRIRERARALKKLASEHGDPLADEISNLREAQATITNLPVGAPVQDNPFLDAAMAAADALRGDGTGKEAGETLFAKSPSPDPSAKTPNIFPLPTGEGGVRAQTKEQIARERYPEEASLYFDSPDWQKNRTGPQKVLKLRSRDQEQIDELSFGNPRQKFDHYRQQQQIRELTDDEVRWVQMFLPDWFDHADMFSDQWPEGDQLWLGKIAPDHFPQYVQCVQEEDQ